MMEIDPFLLLPDVSEGFPTEHWEAPTPSEPSHPTPIPPPSIPQDELAVNKEVSKTIQLLAADTFSYADVAAGRRSPSVSRQGTVELPSEVNVGESIEVNVKQSPEMELQTQQTDVQLNLPNPESKKELRQQGSLTRGDSTASERPKKANHRRRANKTDSNPDPVRSEQRRPLSIPIGSITPAASFEAPLAQEEILVRKPAAASQQKGNLSPPGDMERRSRSPLWMPGSGHPSYADILRGHYIPHHQRGMAGLIVDTPKQIQMTEDSPQVIEQSSGPAPNELKEEIPIAIQGISMAPGIDSSWMVEQSLPLDDDHLMNNSFEDHYTSAPDVEDTYVPNYELVHLPHMKLHETIIERPSGMIPAAGNAHHLSFEVNIEIPKEEPVKQEATSEIKKSPNVQSGETKLSYAQILAAGLRLPVPQSEERRDSSGSATASPARTTPILVVNNQVPVRGVSEPREARSRQRPLKGTKASSFDVREKEPAVPENSSKPVKDKKPRLTPAGSVESESQRASNKSRGKKNQRPTKIKSFSEESAPVVEQLTPVEPISLNVVPKSASPAPKSPVASEPEMTKAMMTFYGISSEDIEQLISSRSQDSESEEEESSMAEKKKKPKSKKKKKSSKNPDTAEDEIEKALREISELEKSKKSKMKRTHSHESKAFAEVSIPIVDEPKVAADVATPTGGKKEKKLKKAASVSGGNPSEQHPLASKGSNTLQIPSDPCNPSESASSGTDAEITASQKRSRVKRNKTVSFSQEVMVHSESVTEPEKFISPPPVLPADPCLLPNEPKEENDSEFLVLSSQTLNDDIVVLETQQLVEPIEPCPAETTLQSSISVAEETTKKFDDAETIGPNVALSNTEKYLDVVENESYPVETILESPIFIAEEIKSEEKVPSEVLEDLPLGCLPAAGIKLVPREVDAPLRKISATSTIPFNPDELGLLLEKSGPELKATESMDLEGLTMEIASAQVYDVRSTEIADEFIESTLIDEKMATVGDTLILPCIPTMSHLSSLEEDTAEELLMMAHQHSLAEEEFTDDADLNLPLSTTPIPPSVESEADCLVSVMAAEPPESNVFLPHVEEMQPLSSVHEKLEDNTLTLTEPEASSLVEVAEIYQQIEKGNTVEGQTEKMPSILTPSEIVEASQDSDKSVLVETKEFQSAPVEEKPKSSLILTSTVKTIETEKQTADNSAIHTSKTARKSKATAPVETPLSPVIPSVTVLPTENVSPQTAGYKSNLFGFEDADHVVLFPQWMRQRSPLGRTFSLDPRSLGNSPSPVVTLASPSLVKAHSTDLSESYGTEEQKAAAVAKNNDESSKSESQTGGEADDEEVEVYWRLREKKKKKKRRLPLATASASSGGASSSGLFSDSSSDARSVAEMMTSPLTVGSDFAVSESTLTSDDERRKFTQDDGFQSGLSTPIFINPSACAAASSDELEKREPAETNENVTQTAVEEQEAIISVAQEAVISVAQEAVAVEATEILDTTVTSLQTEVKEEIMDTEKDQVTEVQSEILQDVIPNELNIISSHEIVPEKALDSNEAPPSQVINALEDLSEPQVQEAQSTENDAVASGSTQIEKEVHEGIAGISPNILEKVTSWASLVASGKPKITEPTSEPEPVARPSRPLPILLVVDDADEHHHETFCDPEGFHIGRKERKRRKWRSSQSESQECVPESDANASENAPEPSVVVVEEVKEGESEVAHADTEHESVQVRHSSPVKTPKVPLSLREVEQRKKRSRLSESEQEALQLAEAIAENKDISSIISHQPDEYLKNLHLDSWPKSSNSKTADQLLSFLPAITSPAPQEDITSSQPQSVTENSSPEKDEPINAIVTDDPIVKSTENKDTDNEQSGDLPSTNQSAAKDTDSFAELQIISVEDSILLENSSLTKNDPAADVEPLADLQIESIENTNSVEGKPKDTPASLSGTIVKEDPQVSSVENLEPIAEKVDQHPIQSSSMTWATIVATSKPVTVESTDESVEEPVRPKRPLPTLLVVGEDEPAEKVEIDPDSFTEFVGKKERRRRKWRSSQSESQDCPTDEEHVTEVPLIEEISAPVIAEPTKEVADESNDTPSSTCLKERKHPVVKPSIPVREAEQRKRRQRLSESEKEALEIAEFIEQGSPIPQLHYNLFADSWPNPFSIFHREAERRWKLKVSSSVAIQSEPVPAVVHQETVQAVIQQDSSEESATANDEQISKLDENVIQESTIEKPLSWAALVASNKPAPLVPEPTVDIENQTQPRSSKHPVLLVVGDDTPIESTEPLEEDPDGFHECLSKREKRRRKWRSSQSESQDPEVESTSEPVENEPVQQASLAVEAVESTTSAPDRVANEGDDAPPTDIIRERTDSKSSSKRHPKPEKETKEMMRKRQKRRSESEKEALEIAEAIEANKPLKSSSSPKVVSFPDSYWADKFTHSDAEREWQERLNRKKVVVINLTEKRSDSDPPTPPDSGSRDPNNPPSPNNPPNSSDSPSTQNDSSDGPPTGSTNWSDESTYLALDNQQLSDKVCKTES